MTATDELRAMLDERGVKWDCPNSCQRDEITTFAVGGDYGGTWYEAFEMADGTFQVSAEIYDELTPAQAIEATLGRGECHNVSTVVDEYGQARFVCSKCGAWIDSRMLWHPEYPNGESPWVKECRLNFCPNCGAKVVD